MPVRWAEPVRRTGKKSEKEGLLMKTQDILNAKVLKAFTKGTFVVAGLFVVLYCGVATLALRSCTNTIDGKTADEKTVGYKTADEKTVGEKTTNEKTIVNNNSFEGKISYDKTVDEKLRDNAKLLIFVFLIPVIVFLIVFSVFSCLVKLHYKRLSKYSENKHNEAICKMYYKFIQKMHKIDINSEALITMAGAIDPNIKTYEDAVKGLLKDVLKARFTVENAEKNDPEKYCDKIFQKIKNMFEWCSRMKNAQKHDSDECCEEIKTMLNSILEKLENNPKGDSQKNDGIC